MADSMHFDLVSPERRLASFDVTEVQLPAVEGDMTAMPNHEPILTTLRPGFLRATGPEGVSEYLVTGGFVEIGDGGGVTVLAERVYDRESITQSDMTALLDDARKHLNEAEPEATEAAHKIVGDLKALTIVLGFSTS